MSTLFFYPSNQSTCGRTSVAVKKFTILFPDNPSNHSSEFELRKAMLNLCSYNPFRDTLAEDVIEWLNGRHLRKYLKSLLETTGFSSP